MDLFPWQADRLLIDFAREKKLSPKKLSFFWYSHASLNDFNRGNRNALRNESTTFINELRVHGRTNRRERR